jgi:general L-amino acid transport system permease protein
LTALLPTDRLLRSRRARRIALEALFGTATGLVVIYLVVQALDVRVGYRYLTGPTGFQISHEWLTSFSPTSPRRQAFLVAVWNTLRAVSVGIVLATLLGVTIGVARLSTNWLVRSMATLFVEAIRNTPLLVQIIFWYFAVFLALPRIENGMDFWGLVFLSNRALALPSLDGGPLAWTWAAALVLAVVVAGFVRNWRATVEDRTGTPGYGNRYAVATFLALALVSYFALLMPVTIVLAETETLPSGTIRYEGGLSVTPEFAALLVGLSVYTAAFIGEIVRGAIQSLPKGQFEAGAALGFTAYERTTLIILPQALRTIIPPLTNQYLNLLKNSSLAVAVAYPEIVFINRTFINSIGHAVPIFLMVLATYMVLSLLISAAMNFLNSRVQVVGR